jgi:predicted ribosomally synthesized peptide with SipW-like signal peptide
MTDDDFELSRRHVLGALGTVGAAGAGAGIGTSAFFSDRESFENNSLVAGTLDATVGYAARYANWSADEADGVSVRRWEGPPNTTGGPADLAADETGLPTDEAWLVAVDDPEAFLANTETATAGEASCPDGTDADDLERPVIDLRDLKPGDFGSVTLEFALCDNPGFVWLTGALRSAAENGLTEPEADDGDEDGDADATDPADVELLDAVQAAVWVDRGDSDGDGYLDGDETLVVIDSLRTVLETLPANGRPTPADGAGNVGNVGNVGLVGDVSAPQGGGIGRNCFSAETVHSVSVAWWLPVDHANEVQSDTVTFDLGLYTEQCRHNRADGRSETTPGDAIEPIVSQPSPGVLRLTASEQAAGTTAITAVPTTELADGSGVSLLSAAVEFESAAPMDLTIEAGASPPAPVPSGLESSGFFSITHSEPDDADLARVRFGVAVDRDRIDEPTDFIVLRYAEDAGWVPLPMRPVGRTPTAYHYDVISPGLSVFGIGTIIDRSNPLNGTPVRLPDGDPRPDPEIVAWFADPLSGSVEIDGLDSTGRGGPVLDLRGVDPDGYPTTIESAFEIVNDSLEPVRPSILINSEAVSVRYDPGFFGRIPPGGRLSVDVEIAREYPVDQLWATLGVPTITDPETDRPILGNADVFVGGTSTFPRCDNQAAAPVMVSEAIARQGEREGWLPADADPAKLQHRVRAELNVRQVGDIAEPIAITVPTTDGPDGSVIAVVDRDGNVGDEDTLTGIGLTVDPEAFTGGSLTRTLDLIVESDDVCAQGDSVGGDDITGTVLDNVGELSILVQFTAADSRWATATGGAEHASRVTYYSPGQSLSQRAIDVAKEALNTWGRRTLAAVFPGGPIRMYRVVRSVRGAAPISGPLTSLMGIWQGVDGLTGVPLTPTAVVREAVVDGVLGGTANVREDQFPDFFPGVNEQIDTEIGLVGPTLYFSTEGRSSAPDPAGFEVDLNPTATFLRASGEDPPTPAIVDLSEHDLSPGEDITIDQRGAYTGLSGPEERHTTIAVFSGSDRLRGSSNRTRVPDAIDAGANVTTPRTFFGNRPTDIPQDFRVANFDGSDSSVTVTIPTGATHLFVAAEDSFYTDNVDRNGDYRVRITRA